MKKNKIILTAILIIGFASASFAQATATATATATIVTPISISKNADMTPASSVVFNRIDGTDPNSPNRAISSISIDPTNPNRAYVSYLSYNLRFANAVPSIHPGHVFRVDGKRRSVWYAKYRLPDGRQGRFSATIADEQTTRVAVTIPNR